MAGLLDLLDANPFLRGIKGLTQTAGQGSVPQLTGGPSGFQNPYASLENVPPMVGITARLMQDPNVQAGLQNPDRGPMLSYYLSQLNEPNIYSNTNNVDSTETQIRALSDPNFSRPWDT